jgi:hypothetical protein
VHVSNASETPVGVVGRVLTGEHAGFFIEVDDDTQRVGGSGGWYVLRWNAEVGYDDWLPTKDDVIAAFAEGAFGEVEWLSAEQSALIHGRHRHGRRDA